MTETSTRVVHIADALRAIAANGLHWTTDEHDRARYDRLLTLAAELLSLADTRSAPAIERAYRGDLGMRTPFVAVDAAVFDAEGRILLIQRHDNRRWAMPGGAAEVGETAAEAAAREVLEETGLAVRVTGLVGVYDSRLVGSPEPVHLYHLVFLGEVTGGALVVTREAVAHGYFTPEAAAALDLHPGHGPRLPDAFRAHRDGSRGAVFQ
jgi:ADP-ribose pyrophosphatase YjhB (NUDIX family)